MSVQANKPVRSPSYPTLSLREAINAVRKIEGRYRTSPVDRTDGAKLIGYSSLSGPANQALASLANYGLVERAGKGLIRVTPRAIAILHPNDPLEAKQQIKGAGLEPSLFQELRERFAGVDRPPEEGIVSYLNRQGFNQSAVRPAVRAFLETLDYLEEAGVSESHGPLEPAGPGFTTPPAKGGVTYGGAKVGDFVQWESQGVLQFEAPRRVRLVSSDGNYVAVEGTETGVPMSQIIVEQSAEPTSFKPPLFPIERTRDENVVDSDNLGTDLRFKVGRGIEVKITSKEELGVNEISKLLALLEAQKIALQD